MQFTFQSSRHINPMLATCSRASASMLLFPRRRRPGHTNTHLPYPACKATGTEQTNGMEPCKQASTQSQANTTSLSGFACLPHVTSASHFWPAWLRVYRPRIESLMRAASSAPAKPAALLPLLDELLFEIKQVSVPALHCSEHHASHEWRAAAAQVHSACHKYEQYVLRNRGLYSKVMEAERKLIKAQASTAGDDPGNKRREKVGAGNHGVQHMSSFQPGSSISSSTLEHSAAHLKGELRAHGVQHDLEQEHLSGEALLHLAQTLLHLFERRGAAVQDEFSTSHFALAHVPDTEDPVWQECMNVVQAERKLASGVRVCVAGASSSPVLPLIYVDWGDGDLSPGCPRAQEGDDDDDHDDDARPPWADDPILLPLLRRTPKLHAYIAGDSSRSRSSNSSSSSSSSSDRDAGARSWGAVLLLDSVATSQVLCHHPNACLRQAVYEAGLESRMETALHLRSQMAAARAAIARANRAPSYAHLMVETRQQQQHKQQQQEQQQPQQQSHLESQNLPQAFLGDLDAAAGMLDGSSTPKRSAHGRVEGSKRLLDACAHAVRGAADQQVRHMAATMGPMCATGAQPQEAAGVARLPAWDVSYTQQRLLQSQGLDVQYEHVQAYMSLHGIIEGLGDVLRKSMGIKLRFLNTTSDLGGEVPAESSLAADLWDAGVIRLVLESWGGGNAGPHADALSVPLGVCYLHPGGGYGTRQLRFARQAPSSLSSHYRRATEGPNVPCGVEYPETCWDQLPVVSVGLQQPWRRGYAGKLAAVMELLHELGHAVHLIASSHTAPYKLFGGLHSLLEVLEVPSILFERFAMDPRSLRAICRLPSRNCPASCQAAQGTTQ
ncbi:hypothetical protein DUNSADRAFT_5496 [Dunaliella salina]|uniref:Uncharacterized protein n=1 Tax=Dunaliella salina TaxID=3046 RepID=A0ABQ7H794_DUNSA|nr:hypothetical protein DUNSADRAFT_5496 [Dunaliella salina]|eukprot:KAF5842728.1 hypothetical protein DUNSADRAFT_5496 [Dunaliella salina]